MTDADKQRAVDVFFEGLYRSEPGEFYRLLEFFDSERLEGKYFDVRLRGDRTKDPSVTPPSTVVAMGKGAGK